METTSFPVVNLFSVVIFNDFQRIQQQQQQKKEPITIFSTGQPLERLNNKRLYTMVFA